ncbi:uncharacterized protein LOC144440991 [Glandiceps talaboti]
MGKLQFTLVMIVGAYICSTTALNCSTTSCTELIGIGKCNFGVTPCIGSDQVCWKQEVTTGSIFTTISRGCTSTGKCQNGCATKGNSPECYKKSDASDYRGMVSVTQSNKRCLYWTSVTRSNYPNAGLIYNYCRNPNGRSKAWCYYGFDIKRGQGLWEYCNVGNPLQYCAVKTKTCTECCASDLCNGASTPSLKMIMVVLNTAMAFGMFVF